MVKLALPFLYIKEKSNLLIVEIPFSKGAFRFVDLKHRLKAHSTTFPI